MLLELNTRFISCVRARDSPPASVLVHNKLSLPDAPPAGTTHTDATALPPELLASVNCVTTVLPVLPVYAKPTDGGRYWLSAKGCMVIVMRHQSGNFLIVPLSSTSTHLVGSPTTGEFVKVAKEAAALFAKVTELRIRTV